MYIDVSKKGSNQELEGFEYENNRGKTERVRLKQIGSESLADGTIVIEEVSSFASTGTKFIMWKQDIPKLIRALQAAQEHLNVVEED